MATNLTTQASAGYAAADGARNPFLHSSPSGIAWDCGRWLKATGRPTPRDVRMSRGYTVRVGDMLIRWHVDGTCTRTV